MIFCFRPCTGRVRRRKRGLDIPVRVLLCLLGAATVIGLLFLSPQWLLVAIIIALLVLVCALIRH